MEGYKVWSGENPDNCMYNLTETKAEAEAILKRWNSTEQLKGRKSGIIKLEIEKCRYGHLFEPEIGCIKCEDLMYDARLEAAAEREERDEFGD